MNDKERATYNRIFQEEFNRLINPNPNYHYEHWEVEEAKELAAFKAHRRMAMNDYDEDDDGDDGDDFLLAPKEKKAFDEDELVDFLMDGKEAKKQNEKEKEEAIRRAKEWGWRFKDLIEPEPEPERHDWPKNHEYKEYKYEEPEWANNLNHEYEEPELEPEWANDEYKEQPEPEPQDGFTPEDIELIKQALKLAKTVAEMNFSPNAELAAKLETLAKKFENHV